MKSIEFFLNDANILIVNNNKIIDKLINTLKQKEYYNIKTISITEFTVKSNEKYLPDLILLNVNAVDRYKYQLYEILKSDVYRSIPIILISEDSNDTERFADIGASDYFEYQFNCEKISECIETRLKIRFMELEFERLKITNTYSCEEIRKENQKLIIENRLLKNEVIQKEKQMEEITLELKEFNIQLEEEISERTKTEEALKESERQFRNSLEKAPIPIMLYTEDGNVRKVNKTWSDITGYTIKDLPTIYQWVNISEGFLECLKKDNISKVLNIQITESDREFLIKTRNGETRIWNFCLAFIGELQDENKLFMIVARDITEKKRVEALQESVEKEKQKLYEIKEYDRIKTEFFSNISHELRTPINVIFSALQLHELKVKDSIFPKNNMDKYKYINIMKQNCYRILRLINNIIDITKIDSGYFDINEKNIDIISLVENITLSVADYIENKGISLIFDTEIEEKIIACDPEKIERIVLNLLSNAVKFTPSGGRIVVEIEDCLENIRIKVKDTGRGIPDEKLNLIFERFMQVDKSLTRDHEGSGIGLSLVKCLVELHGGKISVNSKVNYGSEFTIEIPCKLIDGENAIYYYSDSMSENCIEKINIEFSDIYS